MRSSLEIRGMHCASCVANVEKAIARVPGVTGARVNLMAHRADVDFAEDGDGAAKRGALDAVIAAVRAAGYEARPRISGARASDMEGDANPETVRALGLRFAYTFVAAWAAMFLSMPLMHEGGHAGPIGPFAFVMKPLDVLTRALFPGLWNVDPGVLRWSLFAITLPVLLWSGRGFFVRTWKGLRHRSPDMDTLVAIGTGTAFVVSAIVTTVPARVAEAGLPTDVWYEAVPWVISLVTLGRLLEERAKGKAGEAVRALAERVPRTARVLRDGAEIDLPIEEIHVGDRIALRPGERVPVDGAVESGTSALDESMLTGESRPVAKAAGDVVSAGTTNGSGALVLRATGVGEDTAIARILGLLEEAMAAKPPIQRLVDRVAAVFVPAVLAIAAITFGIWLLLGPNAAFALRAFVTVLIIACPCAMGLAVPAAISVATGTLARRGILLRDGLALEVAGGVDTVVLDKTGTVTHGRPEVVEVLGREGVDVDGDAGVDHALALAAGLEMRSEHPLANAVIREAQRRGLEIVEPETAFAQSGGGMFGKIAGHKVRVGTEEFLRAKGVDTAPLRSAFERAESAHTTPVAIGVDGAGIAVLGIRDPLRDDARAGVDALRRLGARIVLLSGDRRNVAEAVGREIGVDEVHAPASPEDKVAFVQRLTEEGRSVLMVGDGINDAPALAAARVGVAMGGGTDVARGAAPVILVSPRLTAIADLLRMSRRSTRVIRQNLAWAFGYNVLGIPLAAGVLYPWTGWLLSPVFASAAMAASSVSVVANSLRLRLFRGEGRAADPA